MNKGIIMDICIKDWAPFFQQRPDNYRSIPIYTLMELFVFILGVDFHLLVFIYLSFKLRISIL